MNTRQVAGLGAMLAMVVVISAVEGSIPATPFMPPGVKAGFSHIIVMYAVFYLGYKKAVLLSLVKSLFVLITRGPMAATLSLSGGVLSLLLILALIYLFPNISCVATGISGAVVHNIGQLMVYSIISGVNMLFFYAPALIISGVAAGFLTGVLLNKTIPYFNKFQNILTK